MIEQGQVRLTVVVMTHPKRLAHAQELRDSHPELGVKVVIDPEPQGPPTSVRSARLPWECADKATTHHLVLEDDVALAENFGDQVLAALNAQPYAAVSLQAAATSRASFAGRLSVLGGSPWASPIGPYVPTVASVLPTELAAGFARFIAEQAVIADNHDELLKRYLDTVDVPRLVTVPNLVEHQPLPSIEGNVTSDGRRSFCFPYDDLKTDWTAPPVIPSWVPYLMYPPHRHAVGLMPLLDRVSKPVRRPAVELLLEWGVSLTSLTDTFVERLDLLDETRADVDEIAFPLWCTAALLGGAHRMGHPTRASSPPIAETLSGPLVTLSLRSWADGLLEKRFCGEEPARLTAVSRLSSFLAKGIESGFDLCAHEE